jgi:hypothetical protein
MVALGRLDAYFNKIRYLIKIWWAGIFLILLIFKNHKKALTIIIGE